MTAQTLQGLTRLQGLMREGTAFAGLTAYDASFARLFDAQGVDFILVGDSLGMVIQGHDTTHSVTMDEMCYHTRCVCASTSRALLIADLPCGSYADCQNAQHNSQRLIEAGAQMVKLEAGHQQVEVVAALSAHKIPVCAHLGLRPQSVGQAGYRRYGKSKEEAKELRDMGRQLQQAGADLLLLECVDSQVATQITRESKVPVIGIGSGPTCHGQVLVSYDVLGLTDRIPVHARSFMPASGKLSDAVAAYVEAVRQRSFPPS